MITCNPGFAEELKDIGGVESTLACFNCGTCTAICPLIYDSFPRKFIRYAQLGAKELILENALELWKCLHCGLCTQTCPRDAKPGELMLGLKRMALNQWRRK